MTPTVNELFDADVSDTEAEKSFHLDQGIGLYLYLQDVLPTKRSSQHHDKHLRFMRFMGRMANQSAVVDPDTYESLRVWIKSAARDGLLSESYDPESGKPVVSGTSRLQTLLDRVTTATTGRSKVKAHGE